MPWQEDKQSLLASGFSDTEVQGIAGGIADHMGANGYGSQDLEDYFGKPKEPETGHITEYLDKQFQAHLPNDDVVKEAGHADTRWGAVQKALQTGIVSGYQSSVTGLRARGKLPDTALPGDSLFDDTGDKITSGIGRVAEGVSNTISDAPVFLGGGWAGGEAGAATGAAIGSAIPGIGTAVGAGIGGLLGAGGGGFAAQRGMRAALMQSYEQGGVHSFAQFADLTKNAAIESAKGFAVGATTSVAGLGGKAVASTLGLAGLAGAAVPMASELTAMTTAGAAVDGKMPEIRDFVDGALLIGGMHVSGMSHAQSKLMQVFSATAAHPHDVAADTQTDPVLKQQMLATDPEGTPAAMGHLIQPDVRSAQTVVDGHLVPSQEAANQGHYDFTGTPAEFARMTQSTFHPNERAKAAEAHDRVAFKQVNDFSSEVKNLQNKIEGLSDTEGLEGPELIDAKSEQAFHSARLSEIKELGEGVKTRILDAYAKAHDTLTDNLRDRVRNANLSMGETADAKVLPTYNPDFTSQEDHNLSISGAAKEGITAKDADLRKLMGVHADYTPEDGLRDTLSKHPELAKLIAPEMVRETTSPEGKKTLRILPKPARVKEKLSVDNILKNVYNDLIPLKNMSADTQEKIGDFPLSAKPDVLALHSRASLNRAKVFIGDKSESAKKGASTFGPYDPETGKQTNESLYSALNSTPEGDIDGLREFMLYKQIINEHEAGRATGVNDAEAKAYVEQHSAKFAESAKRIVNWNNALLDYARKSGIVSDENFTKWTTEHPDYVPANRVDEESGAGGGKKTGTNVFKTREGSELPFLDPIASMVQKAENIARAVEENNAKKAAVEQNQLLVDAGHEPILEPVTTKDGLDIGDENTAFSRNKDERVKLSDAQMGYYDKGEYKVVEFKNPEVGKLLKFAGNDSATYKLVTKFLKPFNMVASATRFAVSTGSNFVVNHMIRSETFTATVSEKNRLPFIGTMSYLSDAFGKDSPAFVEALKSGALDGIMSDVNQEILKDRAYTLGDEHGALGTVANTIKSVAGAGHALINMQEAAKRMSVFNDIKNASPNATWDDVLAAGKSARRSSVDGLQKGASMQMVTSVIPFMHYEIQGLGRNIEAWKENPKAMAARTSIMLGLTALNWYANKNDDDVQNLPDYQKNAFWNFKVGDHVMRIAKDWGEGKVACTLLERTLDYFENHNPRALEGFADTLKNIVPIPFVNRGSALGEAKETLVNNFNSLTGRQYIPQHLMNLAPEARAMPYTSELGRLTAGVLGHVNGLGLNLNSPMMVDYAIKQFTGDNGVALVRATETILEKNGVIPPTSKPAYEAADIPFIGALISRQPTYNAQPLKDFQGEYTRLKQNYDTYQGYLKAGNMDEAQKFMEAHEDIFNYQQADIAHKAITMATKQIQNYNVTPNDQMSPGDKKMASEDFWKVAIETAKQTLNNLDETRGK